MNEVIFRIEKFYKREMTIFDPFLGELTAQLEMHQGYESKMIEEAKELVKLHEAEESITEPYNENLPESRLRLEKLRVNIQIDSLKNYIQSF